MVKRRLEALEKKIEKAGVGVCTACWGSDGRWGWVPLFRTTTTGDAAAAERPYGRDGRCTSCGAAPRTVVELVSHALPTNHAVT